MKRRTLLKLVAGCFAGAACKLVGQASRPKIVSAPWPSADAATINALEEALWDTNPCDARPYGIRYWIIDERTKPR